jgi:hypothetical protein
MQSENKSLTRRIVDTIAVLAILITAFILPSYFVTRQYVDVKVLKYSIEPVAQSTYQDTYYVYVKDFDSNNIFVWNIIKRFGRHAIYEKDRTVAVYYYSKPEINNKYLIAEYKRYTNGKDTLLKKGEIKDVN